MNAVTQSSNSQPILGGSSANKSNVRNLYYEIAFSSIMGGIITFNSAFAIHMGANAFQIALLGAAPALINALLSIPAGRFFLSRRKHKLWILASLVGFRICYVGVILIPLLVPLQTVSWLILWMIALNLPLAFFTPGWTSLLGEIIEQKQMAFVISRRSIIWAAGIALISALAGVWLDHVQFPLNYQWLYIFGLIMSIPNQYFLNRLLVPDQPCHVPITRKHHKIPKADEASPVKLSTPMKRMLFNIAIYQLGISLPAQLFTIYYINTLHTSDGWIGLNATAANVGVICGYFIWERLIRRRSFNWALQKATLWTWIFPIVLAFVPVLSIIMFFNYLVNVLHPGVDLSTFNQVHKLAGPRERQVYVSWFTLVTNLSLFVAPLLGAWLADRVGIPMVLVLAGILRIVGGLLFNVNGIEQRLPKPIPVHL